MLPVVACGLAVADPRAEDLERYSKSLELEKQLRLKAARDAKSLISAQRWEVWCEGADLWLRQLCTPK